MPANIPDPPAIRRATAELTAVDGTPLIGTLFEPTAKVAGTVVIAGATGVGQRRYRRLAAYLASAGWAALTLDFRDMGASRRRSPKGSPTRVADWGRLDLAAALAWARARDVGKPVVLLGHSMGGQLLGFVPVDEAPDAAILVAVQSAYRGLWRGFARFKAWLIWALMFPLARIVLGYVPGRLFGGDDLPPGVAADGSRWSGQPEYYLSEPKVRERLAAITCPVRAYSFTDDAFRGPRVAVEAFLSWLPAAQKSHLHTSPQDWGLSRVGHFGFFSSRARPLWADVVCFLEQELAGKRLVTQGVIPGLVE